MTRTSDEVINGVLARYTKEELEQLRDAGVTAIANPLPEVDEMDIFDENEYSHSSR